MTTLGDVTERVTDFRFRDLTGIEDPYPVYAEARRAGGLVKADTPRCWGVMRHADVSALLRDRRLGHEFPPEYVQFMMGGDNAGADFQQNSLLNRDPPDHTRLRTLMGQAFSASLVRRLREHITDIFDSLLESAFDRGRFDLVSQLAVPLPVRVICELLGLPPADFDAIRPYAADLVDPDTTKTSDAVVWFREYILQALADRQPDPEGDLLQRMLAAEDNGEWLTHQEIVDNAVLLYFAGFETTSNLIANGCVAMFRNPQEQARLWADPGLAHTAVEEFLRYDTPVPSINRILLEPVEIAGRTIKQGHVAILALASANRDEAAFEDPDRLDISRSPNPHVAFGGGIHHCLGAMLARVEGEVVFRRLAERVAKFELSGDPTRRFSSIRSYAEVPVEVVAA